MMMGTRRALFGLGLGNSQKETPEIHIAILGELGVGKSAMTVKFITRRFIMEYDPTLEDTYTKMETIDGQDVCVKLMDTYDQVDSDPDRYHKWAHGFIIVYSITSRGSFERAKKYLHSVTQIHKHHGREPPIALVGNKMDLERYRTVSKSSGESLASEHDTSFHETSAAEDFDSVEKVFHSIIRDITRSPDSQMALQPLIISEDKSGHLSGASLAAGGRTNIRRVKSPKGSDVSVGNHGNSKKTDDKEQKPVGARRQGVGLRLFKVNKSFKIFN